MNTIEYHKTTTKELLAVKDRVRHLIDHWGEDGRHKEAVLISVIRRFLPDKYNIVSGFVVKQTDFRGAHEASKQIDIIVYDNDYPVLFRDGDFAIVTADSVRAIIEVKANLRNQGVEKVVSKSNEIGQFIFNAKRDKSKNLFNGIFSYAGHERLDIRKHKAVSSALKKSYNSISDDIYNDKFKVNYISFNKDKFYKYWDRDHRMNGGHLYHITDLSFSFFISNLMAYLRSKSVYLNNKLWFPVFKSTRSRKIL